MQEEIAWLHQQLSSLQRILLDVRDRLLRSGSAILSTLAVSVKPVPCARGLLNPNMCYGLF